MYTAYHTVVSLGSFLGSALGRPTWHGLLSHGLQTARTDHYSLWSTVDGNLGGQQVSTKRPASGALGMAHIVAEGLGLVADVANLGHRG